MKLPQGHWKLLHDSIQAEYDELYQAHQETLHQLYMLRDKYNVGFGDALEEAVLNLMEDEDEAQ